MIPFIIVHRTTSLRITKWSVEVGVGKILGFVLRAKSLCYALVARIIVHIAHNDNLCGGVVELNGIDNGAQLLGAGYALRLGELHTSDA